MEDAARSQLGGRAAVRAQAHALRQFTRLVSRRSKTFRGRARWQRRRRWLDDNAGHHKRFMLFVDEFDPHEPFDTPEPYASMYDPDWDGARI